MGQENAELRSGSVEALSCLARARLQLPRLPSTDHKINTVGISPHCEADRGRNRRGQQPPNAPSQLPHAAARRKRSCMTGCRKDAFERLEPSDGKLSCSVLRGLGAGNRVWLPDQTAIAAQVIERKGDYLRNAEENQPKLAEAIEEYIRLDTSSKLSLPLGNRANGSIGLAYRRSAKFDAPALAVFWLRHDDCLDQADKARGWICLAMVLPAAVSAIRRSYALCRFNQPWASLPK